MIEKSELNFYEITKHFLNNSSQLNLFNILKDTSTKTYLLNIFRNYIINEKAENSVLYYINYDVEDSDFCDTISQKYYGTPYLWWVIALFNDILNPFEEFDAPASLKILKPVYLYQLLTEVALIGSQ
jgi:hypothetical protein